MSCLSSAIPIPIPYPPSTIRLFVASGPFLTCPLFGCSLLGFSLISCPFADPNRVRLIDMVNNSVEKNSIAVTGKRPLTFDEIHAKKGQVDVV